MPEVLPPLPSHQLLIFLLQVVLLLTLAFGLARVAQRFGMPAIVGELLAGVLLGPSLLGLVAPAVSHWLIPTDADQARMLDGAAQIGVLLLVGITGCFLDLRMLRNQRATAARISISGLLIPLGLGIGLGFVLPSSLVPEGISQGVFALFIGVAMCVTAIPVIAKTLSDLRMLHRNVGQLTLAAGLIDDIVGWFLLSVVSALATVGLSMGLLSLSLFYLVAFILFAAFVARPLVRRLMRFASRSGQPGPPMAITVILVLLGSAITHLLGLEALFGAFVMGIVIGSVRETKPKLLAPLHSVVLWVLAPLFLASAGLRTDLTTLADPAIALTSLAILVVAIVGKFAGAYLGAKLSRLGHWEALAIGAGMNSRGVVEVIIATVGLRLGVLSIGTYTGIVLVAVITSLMGPPVMRMAMRKVAQTEQETLREISHSSWDTTPAEHREIPNEHREAA
jgi:Kef-type K+ transport system membrane component KefB